MTLALVGSGALLAGLMLTGFSILVSSYAGRVARPDLAAVGRRAFYAAGIAIGLASATLIVALLTHDLAIAFVAEHTDSNTPAGLLVSSFYGGQEGSLLYWVLILSILGSAAVAGAARLHEQAAAYATAILAAVLGFFLLVLAFVANPFDVLQIVPRDGLGLNPILRDGGMLVHPPFLLAGFASFAVPFALAMGSLLAGGGGAAWTQAMRRWALLSWGLQAVGLTLGMWWAYHVLGWGGYWGWDPVENVALLPWLVATAYIHSIQVEEKRQGLRAWNHGLLVLAFLLAIFGTLVVRSGIVQSVHTFAVSAIGPWFFGFLAVAVVGSGIALAARAEYLRSPRPVEVAVSREGAFLLNNLLLLAALAAILWGTVLPLVSGLVRGEQAVVGPSYYDRVAGPCFVVLVALMAIGPLVPWRNAGRSWVRTAVTPVIAGLAVAILAGILGGWRPDVMVAAGVIVAAAVTTVQKLTKGGLGAMRRFGKRRHHYGSYLAHLGLVVVAAGIAGSQLGHVQRQLVARPGQSIAVGGYSLVYQGYTTTLLDHGHVQTTADVALGQETLHPARIAYPDFGGQTDARVAIRSTPLHDLYLVLGPTAPDGSAVLLVVVNPLVTWIWVGAALLIGGVLLANLRLPAKAPAAEAATPRLGAMVRS